MEGRTVSQIVKEALEPKDSEREFFERGFKASDHVALINQDRSMARYQNKKLTALLAGIIFGYEVCEYVSSRVKQSRLDELEYMPVEEANRIEDDVTFGGSVLPGDING